MMKRTGHVGLETLGPPALGGLLLANRGGRDGTREGGDGDDGLGVHFWVVVDCRVDECCYISAAVWDSCSSVLTVSECLCVSAALF